MDELARMLSGALGLDAESGGPDGLQMGLRALAVYVAILVLVRLAKKRFMGRATAFDVILAIMLGSIASRAVTGNAPFLPSLAACAVLLALHWVFSAVAVRWHGFGVALKGKSRVIVQDGQTVPAAMRAAHLSERDLFEEMRRQNVPRLQDVAEARLERSGDISIVTRRASG